MPPIPDGTVLLTGASGYIGGRLLRRLEASGRSLRCLTRRPDLLRERVGPQVEVVEGDVLDRGSLDAALEGIHTACYLVHSMTGPGDFEILDRRGAINFADATRAAAVSQIVYLGGLGHDDELSPHLSSRHEVGRLLRDCGVPTIELRASIVIGSGSASFETVRALVEHLPVIVAPRWVETLAQPIAIEDVIEYLLAALQFERPTNAVYEIGGADQVTYADVMREYARQRGLHRRVVRVPLVTPRISRVLLGLLTPVYGRVAATMVDSLRNETIVTNPAADATFSNPRRGLSASIERALVNEDQEFAETRWSDALPAGRPLRWGGIAFGRRLVASRMVRVGRRAEEAFTPIQRIGGNTGWYANNWFWRLRGFLDTLRGGVGLRRGRRDPYDLRVGDCVDFWRVERLEPGRLLLLAAEMKIPGRLWLQFEVDPAEHHAMIRQTTVFDPYGYVGLAYWYLLYPVHSHVFSRMLRGIQRAIPPFPALASARAGRRIPHADNRAKSKGDRPGRFSARARLSTTGSRSSSSGPTPQSVSAPPNQRGPEVAGMQRLCRITVPGLSIARDYTAARRRLMDEFPNIEEVVATTAPGTLVVLFTGPRDVDGWLEALRGLGAKRRTSSPGRLPGLRRRRLPGDDFAA